MSRDDCRNPYCRDVSTYDSGNLLRREVSRDDSRNPLVSCKY